MKTTIPLVAGALVALWLSRWMIPLFKSEAERPSYGNLKYPMPNWLVVICAIWAAIGGGVIVAIIIGGWLSHLP